MSRGSYQRGGHVILAGDANSRETPTTVLTGPLPFGDKHDGYRAADDGPWAWSVEDRAGSSVQPRSWSSAVLGAAGIAVLAALVIGVLVVANASTAPVHIVAPSTRTTQAPAPTPTSGAPGPSLAPVAPPAFSPTATASTVNVAPPVMPAPVMPAPVSRAAAPVPAAPRTPGPKPTIRQRLHDLFPRLVPDP